MENASSSDCNKKGTFQYYISVENDLQVMLEASKTTVGFPSSLPSAVEESVLGRRKMRKLLKIDARKRRSREREKVLSIALLLLILVYIGATYLIGSKVVKAMVQTICMEIMYAFIADTCRKCVSNLLMCISLLV